MSNDAFDCSAVEERIYNHNLYISTTQDQINKLDPNDKDVEEQREALNRKLDALQKQLSALQEVLKDCQQGKEVNFPNFEIAPEDITE